MFYVYALAVVVLMIAAFLAYVATRPSDFRIVRSARMTAPPARVFEEVNALKNWEKWSPWARLDPAMVQAYAGPPEGVGSFYSWLGNSKVGEGKMTITDSRPPAFVRIKLEFLKPFKATNTADFEFKGQGHATLVTWSMTGTNNFVAKIFCTFMNMDKMVGKDFEKGLASLRAVVEG